MDAIFSPAVEPEGATDSTIDTVSRLVSGAFSRALTGFFAMGDLLHRFDAFDHGFCVEFNVFVHFFSLVDS